MVSERLFELAQAAQHRTAANACGHIVRLQRKGAAVSGDRLLRAAECKKRIAADGVRFGKAWVAPYRLFTGRQRGLFATQHMKRQSSAG